MGSKSSKHEVEGDAASQQPKQKGRGSEASKKGEYVPDEFQTAAFDLKCLIQDSEALDERLEGEIAAARKKAKGYMRKKPPRKDRAIFLMKLAKLHMKHIGDVRNRIVMLQKTLDSVYTARDQREFVESLKLGNQALKVLQEGMDIESVQAILDEKADLEDLQEQLGDIIADFNGVEGDMDDETLLAEVGAVLDGVEDADADADAEAAAAGTSGEAADAGEPLDLPEAPTHDPAEVEAERKRLEVEAAKAKQQKEEAERVPVLVAAE